MITTAKIKVGFFCAFLTVLAASTIFSPVSTASAFKSAEVKPTAEWGTGEAASISYSEDGSLMAVGSVAGHVLIYDTDNYDLLQEIDTGLILEYAGLDDSRLQYLGATGAVSISPDNKSIGVVAVDGSVGIWDIQSGKKYFNYWGEGKGSYVFSSYSGQWSGYFLGDGELFVSLHSGQKYGSNHSQGFALFRINDGTLLAQGSLSNSIHTKDLSIVFGNDGIEKTNDWITWTLDKTDTKIKGLLIDSSPNARYVANFINDSALTVMDVTNGKVLFTIPDIVYWDSAFSFSGNNQTFISSSTTDDVTYQTTVWSITDKTKIGEFELPFYPSFFFSVRPAADQLAYPIPGGVEIVSLPDGTKVKTILFNSCAGLFKLSPDGKWIASHYSRWVYICQSSDGKLVRTMNAEPVNVMDIAWSPDSIHLAASGAKDTLIVWDTQSGEAIHSFKGHSGGVELVAYSPDGQTIASVGFQRPTSCSHCCYFINNSGNEIILRQASDGKVIVKFPPTNKYALQIDFSKDSSKLIYYGGDPCSSDPYGIFLADFRGISTRVTDGIGFQILNNGELFSEKDGQIWDISGQIPKSLGTNPKLPSYSWVLSSDQTMRLVTKDEKSSDGQKTVRDILLSATDGSREITLLQETLYGHNFFGPISAAFYEDDTKLLYSRFDLTGVFKVFSTADLK